MSVVLTSYQVLLRIEGAASLLSTGPMKGMRAAVQTTPNGGASALTTCTPTTQHGGQSCTLLLDSVAGVRANRMHIFTYLYAICSALTDCKQAMIA